MPIANTTGEQSEVEVANWVNSSFAAHLCWGDPPVAVAGAYRRCSEGSLSPGSKAIKNIVLLLPDSCTCSLLIEAGREG